MTVKFISVSFTLAELETIKKILVVLEKDTKVVDDKALEKGMVLKTKEQIEAELKSKYEKPK